MGWSAMPEAGGRHISELVSEVFRRAGVKRALKRAEAVLLWSKVVGPEVAKFTAARAMDNGVLYVDVGDSETAMHLSLQRRRFLAVYHETYRAMDVKEIRFQVGRLARSAAGEPGSKARQGDSHETQAPADPQAVAQLARDLGELGLSEELGAAALRAGRSLLGMRARQLALGHSACPTCGALHGGLLEPPTARERALQGRPTAANDLPDKALCLACRRYADDPNVRAAAGVLALDPDRVTPLLAEDERSVALRLAVAYLDRAMTGLLLEALADPGVRPQLIHAARCRAAIASGKGVDELDEGDKDLLDVRYRRFIGDDWLPGGGG